MGFGLNIAHPPKVTINMDLIIEVLNNYEQASILAQANTIIKEYLEASEDGEFGEGVKRGRLSNLLLQIAGTQNVVFTLLHNVVEAVGVNDITVDSIEIINYTGSTINVSINGGE